MQSDICTIKHESIADHIFCNVHLFSTFLRGKHVNDKDRPLLMHVNLIFKKLLRVWVIQIWLRLFFLLKTKEIGLEYRWLFWVFIFTFKIYWNLAFYLWSNFGLFAIWGLTIHIQNLLVSCRSRENP